MKVHAIIASVLALSGCSKSPTIDGFKDITFGLSEASVQQLGFSCTVDGDCSVGEPATPPTAASVAGGDIAKGEAAFRKCAACHTISRGGENGIGPNLYAIVGDAVAQGRAGYAFTDALKAKGGLWTFAALDAWLYNPKGYAPGTKMTFAGMSDPQQRADLIAYLNAQGSNLPLAETGRDAATDTAAQEAPQYTLFGKEARVTLSLTAAKVSSVDVSIALDQKTAIELLGKEYGRPDAFEYDNYSGGRSRVTYWLSDNGTSVSTIETLAEGALGIEAMTRREGIDVSDYLRSHTTVHYRDRRETEALIKQSKRQTIDPNDI